MKSSGHKCYTSGDGKLWIAALLLFLLQLSAHAQTSRVGAALEGSVTDSAGGAIAGASVVVRNLSTSQTRTMATNAAGSFHAEAWTRRVLRLTGARKSI
jgi:hypothetical protein